MGLFLCPLKDPGYCERRGRHGPFVNHEIYRHFPGWEKNADCSICGSTVRIGPEAARPHPNLLPSGRS